MLKQYIELKFLIKKTNNEINTAAGKIEQYKINIKDVLFAILLLGCTIYTVGLENITNASLSDKFILGFAFALLLFTIYRLFLNILRLVNKNNLIICLNNLLIKKEEEIETLLSNNTKEIIKGIKPILGTLEYYESADIISELLSQLHIENYEKMDLESQIELINSYYSEKG